MIPVLAIIKILATTIGIIATYKGYKKWKENKLLSMEYFWKCMFWLTLTCVGFMVMPLFSANLSATQIVWIFCDFTCVICFAYLFPLVLIFLGGGRFHLIAKRILLIGAVLILLMDGLFFKEAVIQTYPLPFGNLTGINWASSLPFPFSILLGVVCILSMLVFIPLLTKKTLSLTEPIERKKGICVTLGILGLVLAGTGGWFVGPLVGYFFWKDFIQGLLCASGQTFFTAGMLIKK